MSYQVIARKWRPQAFSELIGQPHVSQSLLNALKADRVPHAILFTGPRGTGKTSSARILAKSLRCENPVNFTPCNVCQSCIEITRGSSVDVIEIDGASNNGVDSIRELKESVSYRPAFGKYKIYIIDEVHMLSTSAFNALLKTLEEPPEHVLFMMATTEAQKIPQTILSRCQRFDLRMISTREIADHLKEICIKENFECQTDALWMIARQGAGSMRDALSLLDQVLSFGNGSVEQSSVIEILGITDRSLVLNGLQCIIQRDINEGVKLLEGIFSSGGDVSLYLENILELVRDLLVISLQKNEKNSLSLDLPDSEIKLLQQWSQDMSQPELHWLFDLCLKALSDIKRAGNPKLVFEVVFIRLLSAPYLRQISDLSKNIQSGTAASQPVKPLNSESLKLKTSQKVSSSVLAKSPREKWFELVQRLKDQNALLAAKVDPLIFVSLEKNEVKLAVPQKMSFLKETLNDLNFRESFESFIEQTWGARYTVKIDMESQSSASLKTGASSQEMAHQLQEKKKLEISAQVAEHPLVKSASIAFKGQIKSIRSTNGTKEER